MLKDQEKMPYVIVTDRNTIMMNFVGNEFPTSYVLHYRYHITKNVIGILKYAVGTKQTKVNLEKW